MELRLTLALVLALLLSSTAVAAGGSSVEQFDSLKLASLARKIPVGGNFRVEGVDLRGTKQAAAFELERFTVFAPGARIVVHGEAGDSYLPVPDNVYFRGAIAGEPGSSVLLTSLAGGALRGIAASGGEYWVMASGAGGLELRQIDGETEFAEQVNQFACGNSRLEIPEGALSNIAESVASGVAKGGGSYTASVAVETDYEFFQLFAGAAEAIYYIADLFAYMSVIYSAEVNTAITVSHVSLWGTSADPWTQTSPSCGLYEFGRYWNDNLSDVYRTFAHMLSGKNNGGGVAWVGVLCRGAFSVGGVSAGCPTLTPDFDNYGGDYGYTGGIDGNFTLANPNVVWDIVATTHEVGHNFNSRHTHCYAGVGGNASPVDECYAGQCGGSGCYCGSSSLPCGTSGAGCGTIMSYCHLLGGGMSNLSLTLGAGHGFGVEPERVPTRMNEHVTSVSSSNPACLPFGVPPDQIFTDGFDSGVTARWTATVP